MKFSRASKFFVFCSLMLAMTAARSTDIVIENGSSGPTVHQMDEKLAQNAAVRNATELFGATSDPVAGNPNGRVTLVEFFDFRCPHCEHMSPTIAALIAVNPDLRIVYKNFPILGAKSMFAAQAALAAIPQGKYLAFHDALMSHGRSLEYENVLKLAQSVGLNVPQLKAAMNNEKINSQLNANVKLGRSLGVIGTPSFFVAKTNLPMNAPPTAVGFAGGEVDQRYLQYLVNEARLQ